METDQYLKLRNDTIPSLRHHRIFMLTYTPITGMIINENDTGDYILKADAVREIDRLRAQVALLREALKNLDLRSMSNNENIRAAALVASESATQSKPQAPASALIRDSETPWTDAKKNAVIVHDYAGRPTIFIVKAWGDEIECPSEIGAAIEVREALELGARNVSVEMRERPKRKPNMENC